MTRFLIPAAFGALLLTPLAATAQEQDSPGQFDFYVLSLSWSPSFCAAAAERGRRRAANAQCGVRPYSFVVHGLWPQYEKGSRNTVSYRHRGSTAASSLLCWI